MSVCSGQSAGGGRTKGQAPRTRVPISSWLKLFGSALSGACELCKTMPATCVFLVHGETSEANKAVIALVERMLTTVYKIRIDKVDGMLDHELCQKLSDISGERGTYPQMFKRDDDTGEYTFLCNGESAKSYNECSAYAKELGGYSSDAVQANEILKKQCIEWVFQDVM